MPEQENKVAGGASKPWIYLVIALFVLILAVVFDWQFFSSRGSPVQSEPYVETFDSAGTWTAGEGVNAEGQIVEGAYEMSVELVGDIFWATAGQNLSDGIYQVEATPLEGAQDNGYGMLFRVAEDESFYVFKVSSDGFVFIAYCKDSCNEQQALVDRDWFASPAVLQGLGVTNRLRADLSGPDMIFYVNNEEVGRAFNDTLQQGDIGLMAETFAPGGLRIAFDNFTVMPINTE